MWQSSAAMVQGLYCLLLEIHGWFEPVTFKFLIGNKKAQIKNALYLQNICFILDPATLNEILFNILYSSAYKCSLKHKISAANICPCLIELIQ